MEFGFRILHEDPPEMCRHRAIKVERLRRASSLGTLSAQGLACQTMTATTEDEDQQLTPQNLRVALPVFSGVSAATVMGFYDVLSCAGRAWQAMTGQETPPRLIEPVLVGGRCGEATCANGASVNVARVFESAQEFDLAIVSSILLPPQVVAEGLDPRFLSWLKAIHRQGCAMASVCSGSLALAEAGLLEGLEATTHWAYAGWFKERYPRVTLRAERLLVDNPVEPRIVTAGGGSSWHDLALHIVERYISTEVAAQTARVFLMHWHKDQQTLFACLTPQIASTDGAVARAQQWMRRHFGEPDVIETAAESSGLNKRTYQRRFRQATGLTPTQHLQLVRVERAKEILQTTTKPVTEVGWAVGYEDAVSFRRVFKELNGIGPGEFRRRFLRPR